MIPFGILQRKVDNLYPLIIDFEKVVVVTILQGIDHVTVNITDPEKALSFYRNVFQLEPLPTVDMGDHILYYFALPEGNRLELIQYKDPQKICPVTATTPGTYRHVAFRTDNIEKVYKSCQKYGAEILAVPSYNKKLRFTNMLLRDSNGVEIEVVQREAE